MSKLAIIKNVVTTAVRNPKVLVGLGFVGGVGTSVMVVKVVNDVKNGLQEALTEIIESDRKSRARSYRTHVSSYRNYNSYKGYTNNSFQRRHKYDELVFETKREADDLYDELMRLDSKYQIITIADLYTLVGYTSSLEDRKYGWKDLTAVSVGKNKYGYYLNLPKPILLDTKMNENGGK